MNIFEKLFRRSDQKTAPLSDMGSTEAAIARVLERSQRVRTRMAADIEKFVTAQRVNTREADTFRSTYLESLGALVEEPCRQSRTVSASLIQNRPVLAKAQDAVAHIDAFWSKVRGCLDGSVQTGSSGLETTFPQQPKSAEHGADIGQDDARAIAYYLQLRSTLHVLKLNIPLWDKGAMVMRLQKGMPPIQHERLSYLVAPERLMAESAHNYFAFERMMLLGLLEKFRRKKKCVAEVERLVQEVTQILEVLMTPEA
jgi:hypothetical protein